MPRPITAVRLPISLAIEIDRLLHCTEMAPLIGDDAARARRTLRALAPSSFPDQPIGGPTCTVCSDPIPMDRALNAAMRGQQALYDTGRCRETARKRRYRQS